MKIVKALLVLGLISFGFIALTELDQDKWIVLDKYEKMTNLEENSKENIAIGKSLYSKHCKSCRGKEGYYDGSKAEEVDGDLGDFSSDEFQTQSDRILFYKCYVGKKDMLI